jgi:hypothetical protein
MPTDLLQSEISVGDTVLVPCIVTALTTGPSPTVTLETKYPGFDGNTDVVGPIDAPQVILQT